MTIPIKQTFIANTLALSIVFSFLSVMSPGYHVMASDSGKETVSSDDKDRLVVLWTTADRDVALKMIMLYTYNAKKNDCWKDIVVIVWGPSAKLLSEDPELQGKIKEMIDVGIVVKACKGCSDQFEGASERLEALGVEVLYVGKEFTDYLKSENTVLTL